MAYDFNTAYLNNLQDEVNQIITKITAFSFVQPPATETLLTHYVPLSGSEKPEDLQASLNDVADFINSDYHSLATRPTWNTSWPTDVQFKSILSDIGNISYNPIAVELHNHALWNETTDFSQIIVSAIQNGEIASWDDWAIASYAQDDLRALQQLRDAMDAAGAAIGARGFRKPNSRVKQIQHEAIEKYQLAREDKNRKIMGKLIEQARTYMQSGLEAGSSLERIHTDFTSAYNSFLVKAKQQAVEIYKARIEAEILKFEGQVKEAMYVAEFNLENAKGELARINGVLQTFKADVQYNLISNEKAKYYMKAYNEFVDAYNARVGLMKEQIDNQVEEISSNIKRVALSLGRYNASLAATLTNLNKAENAAQFALSAANTAQIVLNKGA